MFYGSVSTNPGKWVVIYFSIESFDLPLYTILRLLLGDFPSVSYFGAWRFSFRVIFWSLELFLPCHILLVYFIVPTCILLLVFSTTKCIHSLMVSLYIQFVRRVTNSRGNPLPARFYVTIQCNLRKPNLHVTSVRFIQV